jgi:hypothetical protein
MGFGDADRDVFVDAAVFGTTVVVGVTTGNGVLSFRWLEPTEPYGARTQAPVLRVKRGAFTRPALDATVKVGGVNYAYRGKADAAVDAAESGRGFEDWLLAGGTSD